MQNEMEVEPLHNQQK